MTEHDGPTKTKRTISQLRFPYYDLQAVIEVVRRIFDERGGRVTQDGLAEMLGTSKSRSAFQVKVIAAQLFGLIKRDPDGLAVTDLALRIVRPRSPSDEAQAIAEAFLSVPLFDAVQERYAGRPLPPDEGLRNALEVEFGVVRKRISDAFGTLTRSAEQAGLLYRSGGNTYLSRGTALGEPLRAEEPPPQPRQDQVAAAKAAAAGAPHPALSGLLQVLPADDARWSTQQRDRWLEAFSATIKVLYPVEDEK
jgi:hypothetical protein